MEQAGLMDACRRGDRSAQHELYKRYGERIYRLTLRLAGNAQDAFDLTQETFIRAFQRISAFDGRSGVGTWLYRIATNEALQLFRKRGTEQRHLRVLAEQRSVAANPGSATDSPDVDGALAQLSGPHRAILILKYQEGLSYEEIAEVLEIAPGTVASRMNRARAELRAILADESTLSGEETADQQHPTGRASGPDDKG
ncbi:MAG: sigma-70 family RNA polymerase sigma factor [Planctomycetes bacterium]|nr:sigma-70 family RNA polymerase sigma factor [Planctomycetota bacterium]